MPVSSIVGVGVGVGIGATATLTGLCAVFLLMVSGSTTAARYEPTWESLDKRPLPRWYDEAKVGIFIHWGVYSVPSYGSEWFWHNWLNIKNVNYTEFMRRNYKPNFSYQGFAKDFTAELFNATEWSNLLADSGAKYVVLTSKHHDGYCLWPSMESFGWNAMDIGPGRDIIRELSSAVRQHEGMKFGLYYSLFEWFNRMYIDDKLHIFLQQNYVDRKVHPERVALVQQYQPDVFWSDGDWEAPDKYWRSQEFIAWLYNDSPVRDTVVVNDRWGFGTACLHGDFYNCQDRYNPGTLMQHKWENALTLDKGSWGHRTNANLNDYMTSKELIQEIVSTVSCNGNVLINIGPTMHGTIDAIFQERLRDMGQWLGVNGEAIYGSEPWMIQRDNVTAGVWYTSKTMGDIVNVYAIVLEYPYDTNEIDLQPFAGIGVQSSSGSPSPSMSIVSLYGIDAPDAFDAKFSSIVLLGMENTKIEWSVKNNAIHVVMPPKHHIDKYGLQYAWTLKMSSPKMNNV